MIVGNAKGYTKLIMDRFAEIGYRPQLFLVNAADCGVPQKRERVFFCALREDIEKPALQFNPKHRWITAGEAIADIGELLSNERQETAINNKTDSLWWARTKPGEAYSDATLRHIGMPRFWNIKKFSPNVPSLTLTATDGFRHWSEQRLFTFREWKRLGSFPDDYQAKTDKIGKYMVGMSVPPKMTEAVARAVIEQWLS